MNKQTQKLSLQLVAVILISIIISCLLEIFAFNSFYFSLEKKDRGNKVVVEKKDLILSDMVLNSDGSFTIIGENPSFEIPVDSGIQNLVIKPQIKQQKNIQDSIEVYDIKCEGNNNRNTNIHTLDERLSKIWCMKVNSDDSNVIFSIHSSEVGNENTTEFSMINKNIDLGEIVINNQFMFNGYRFFMMFSIIIVIVGLCLFRKTLFNKLEIVFLLIIILLGTNIAILKPCFASFDEQAHFIKAYKLAAGDIGVSNTKEVLYPDDFEEFYNNIGTFNSFSERKEYEETHSKANYTIKEHYNSTADGYLPFAYLPAALGIFLGRIMKLPSFALFYFGRVTSLIVYALLLFLTLKDALYGKKLIFILGLLPGMVYLATSYSVDGMLYACSLVMLSAYLNIMVDKGIQNSRYWKVFFISYILMILCKPTYMFLGLLVLTVPKDKFKRNEVLIKGGTLLIGIMMVVITLIYMKKIVQPPIDTNGLTWIANESVSAKGQISFIIHNFSSFIKICYQFVLSMFISCFTHPIGQYGYVKDMDMLYILIALFMMIIVAILDDENSLLKISVKNKLVYALSIFLSWGAVVGTLYLTFTPVGSMVIEGVQGRYFAPLLLPFLLLFKCTKVHSDYNAIRLNVVITVFSILLLLTNCWTVLVQYNM